jgi:transcription elongation factor Elf1
MVGFYHEGIVTVLYGVCRNCGISAQAEFDSAYQINLVEQSVDKGHFAHNPILLDNLRHRIENFHNNIPIQLFFEKTRAKVSADLQGDETNPELIGEWVEAPPSKTCPACNQEESIVYAWDEMNSSCPQCGLNKLKVLEC